MNRQPRIAPQPQRPARERQLALTAVSLLLLAVALLLAVTSVGASSRNAIANTERSVARHAVSTEHGLSSKTALVIARRFLHGYLPFVYGQQPVSFIADATPQLASALADRRPTPPALKALHPRVLSLTSTPAGEDEITVTALVKDSEVVAYPITLLLTGSGGRVRVARVGES